MSPDAEQKVEIGSGSESDALQLSRLAAALFHQAYRGKMPLDVLESFIAGEFGESRQRAELRDPAVSTLLVEVDGELAGYAQLRLESVPVPVDADVSLELWRIYLDRACHGRGIGRKLLGRVFEIARQSGHPRLWLGVWEQNPGAIEFYRSCGFSVVGSQPFTIGREQQRDLVMIGRVDTLDRDGNRLAPA